VLEGLVERPTSWLPAGHRAITVGEKARAEEGDDRRGRDVSERERERESATGRAVLLGHVGTSAWAGRAVGQSRREKGGVGPR
jgi:hypothetical protein